MNGRFALRLRSSDLFLAGVLVAVASSGWADGTTAPVTADRPAYDYRPVNLSQQAISTTSPLPVGDLAFNPATMMRVSDLRPGMKGFGLTVFSGIRPERFEAEIIGVRHKSMMAGQDIILCRLSSPRLEGIGVVGGMSGSPIYIDGKLIGAVGYGWPTDKVPLAGVTPVEDMLRVLNATRDAEVNADGPGSSPIGGGGTMALYEMWLEVLRSGQPTALKQLASLQRTALPTVPASEFGDLLGGSAPSGDMVALSAPFYLSSASPATRQLMPLLFPGRDWLAVGGMGGMGGGEEARRTLSSPGGPIDPETLAREIDAGWGLSVPLVDGDFNLAGVGTVSFRHGNRLAAFGHPMWGRGLAAMPAAGARINTIVHSIQRPFKIGESLGQFGMITQDRLPAIGVMVGKTAPMFPVRVTVNDPQYAGERTLNMRVWNDREQSANYLLVSLIETMEAISRSSAQASTDISYTLRFNDGTEIRKSRFVTDTMGGILPALYIGAEVGVMVNNPFKPVQPESVEVSVRTGYHMAQAMVERMTLDRQSYRPGEEVSVTVELRPWRGEKQVRELRFTLPENLADGTYGLMVGDSNGRQALDMQLNPGLMRITKYENLVRLVRRNFAENRLYLTLTDRDAGASVDGVNLERLPASVLSTLAGTALAGDFAPIQGNLIVDKDEITPYELSGVHTTAIVVSRKRN